MTDITIKINLQELPKNIRKSIKFTAETISMMDISFDQKIDLFGTYMSGITNALDPILEKYYTDYEKKIDIAKVNDIISLYISEKMSSKDAWKDILDLMRVESSYRRGF